MAIKPVNNETFYREVDEELRRDQMSGLWKRYGWAIVGGVVLLLALIGGIIWWQNQKQAKTGEQGETLTGVFQDVQGGKANTVAPRIEQLATEGTPGYRAAALLARADLAIQNGNDAAAITAFKAVAADEGLAEPYRNLALIRHTTLEFDTLPPATVVQRMQPFASAGNPWLGSAGELVGLAHLKANQPREAARIFAAMAGDKALPGSLRSRAVQMAGALGVDATQDAAGPGAAATKE